MSHLIHSNLHLSQVFIEGEWRTPAGSAVFPLVMPSTEDELGAVALASAQDMADAVAAARRAFDDGPWPRMTHAERAGFLRAAGAALAKRSAELSYLWSAEVGAIRAVADRLTGLIPGVFDFYASLADSFPFEERHQTRAGAFGLLVQEPVGVVGAIVPWNATLQTAAYKVAPALIAGCTVVVKSSPESPGAAYVMAEVMREIGLPPGVFNLVTADRDVSELLVTDERVDKITFTGSSAAGRRIASLCGARMARCTLELGGKSAGVVLPDADIGKVAASLAASTRVMAGQVCAAITRVIVPRERAAALADAMAAEFAATKVGDPLAPDTQMGPLAMQRQHQRVSDYIASGISDGARLASGGGRPAGLDRGYYVEPTLFTNADTGMTIAREEIFGPVVCMIPARDESEMIAIANDSPFGLNGAVFSDDPDRCYAVARQLRTGTVGQNGSRAAFDIAFGGFKQSGIGREGGIEGLRPFLEAKTIVLEAPLSHHA